MDKWNLNKSLFQFFLIVYNNCTYMYICVYLVTWTLLDSIYENAFPTDYMIDLIPTV